MDSHFAHQGDRTLEIEFSQRLQQSPFFKESPTPLPQKWFKQWAQAVVDYLTGAQALSIRQKLCKDGSVQWIAYDPYTRSRHVFSSEQAVRVWLEQR